MTQMIVVSGKPTPKWQNCSIAIHFIAIVNCQEKERQIYQTCHGHLETNILHIHLVLYTTAFTCIWSPAKTILVFLLANARGIIVSHSIACAASSNRMCVKKPVRQR